MGRFSKVLGAFSAAALACAMTLCAQAETYDISQGDIQIIADGAKQTVIFGSQFCEDAEPVVTGQGGSVLLRASEGAVLHVTFRDAEADFSSREDTAPVTVEGEGKILLELDGINSFTGGSMHAGVETGSAALYITDEREPSGVLNAQGGRFAAGIGGGAQCDGGNVFVLGGAINARGGTFGAGIGGGQSGRGMQIAVLGGQVSASGGVNAAGVGGGWCAGAENICIVGGSLTVNGSPAAQSLTVAPEFEELFLGDGFIATQAVKAGETLLIENVDNVAVIAHAEAYAEEVPAEDATAEEAPAEEVPAEKVPAEEVPVEEAPAEEAPAEEAPSGTEEQPPEEAAEAVSAAEAVDEPIVTEAQAAEEAEETVETEQAETVDEISEHETEATEADESAKATDETNDIAMQNLDHADVTFTSHISKKLLVLRTECSAPIISIRRGYIDELRESGVTMLRIYCGSGTITTNLNTMLSRAAQTDTVVLNVVGGNLRMKIDGKTVDVPVIK